MKHITVLAVALILGAAPALAQGHAHETHVHDRAPHVHDRSAQPHRRA
ncbi:MAG TPA: hypothetical protein VGC07_05840 [Granulicella sp.]